VCQTRLKLSWKVNECKPPLHPRFTRACPPLDRAWLQRLKLTYDELLSSFALKFSSHHYEKVFNPRKTVLLFVIRDKSRTPLEKLQAGGGSVDQALHRRVISSSSSSLARMYEHSPRREVMLHSTDVESPPPPPPQRVCMSIHPKGSHAPISDRVLVINDPTGRRTCARTWTASG